MVAKLCVPPAPPLVNEPCPVNKAILVPATQLLAATPALVVAVPVLGQPAAAVSICKQGNNKNLVG